MNSFNHSDLVKHTVALLGMTGLAAFSGLPALAQPNTNSINNGVLNSVNCSAYVNGGVGGPTDNSRRSSDDTATIPQNRSSDSLNQSNTNYPPGVLGNSAVSANQDNAGRSSYDTAIVPQNRSAMNSNNSFNSYNSSGMRRDGQFSATNPNAAISFRSNGPAGTSGGESNLNLQAFRADREASFMQSAMSSETNNRAYSAPDQSSSYQSANPIPVECLPGAVNKR